MRSLHATMCSLPTCTEPLCGWYFCSKCSHFLAQVHLDPREVQPIVNKRVSTVCTASPSAGKWSSPTTTGPRPPPSSGFTFTAVNHHKAVYFGGNQPGRGRVNDLYVIDFDQMVPMIRVHALAKCVDSSNSIQTLEIGHIPMASGILQSYQVWQWFYYKPEN